MLKRNTWGDGAQIYLAKTHGFDFAYSLANLTSRLLIIIIIYPFALNISVR